MANFSTIGELSAAAAQSQTKNNPFESLSQGFQSGMQQGAQQANNLMQRQLQMKQMQVEQQYKQQELGRQVDDKIVDSFNSAVNDADPARRKAKFDELGAFAQKYNRPWNKNYADVLAKSDDARSEVTQALAANKYDPTNPQHRAMLAQKLTDPRGANMGIKESQDYINSWAQQPVQMAEAKERTNAMLAAVDRRQSGAEHKMAFANAMKAANPDEISAMQSGDPEKADAAMTSALARFSTTSQKKNDADIAYKNAAAGKSGDKRNDDAIKDVEKSKAFSGLEESRTWLDKASGNLHPGGMSRLELKEALLGAGKAFSGAARAGQSLAADAELKTAIKSVTKAAGYFSGDPGEPVSEEEYRNVQKVFDQARAATDGAMKKYAQTSLYSKFGQKKLDRDIGNGWYKGRFGEDLPPAPWEKTAGGGQKQNGSGGFTIKGQQYTKDELKASAQKNGDAGKTWYKSVTGEDL